MADKKNVQGETYHLDVEGHVTKKELERLQEKLEKHKREWERINGRLMREERQKALYGDSSYNSRAKKDKDKKLETNPSDSNAETRATKSESEELLNPQRLSGKWNLVKMQNGESAYIYVDEDEKRRLLERIKKSKERMERKNGMQKPKKSFLGY